MNTSATKNKLIGSSLLSGLLLCAAALSITAASMGLFEDGLLFLDLGIALIAYGAYAFGCLAVMYAIRLSVLRNSSNPESYVPYKSQGVTKLFIAAPAIIIGLFYILGLLLVSLMAEGKTGGEFVILVGFILILEWLPVFLFSTVLLILGIIDLRKRKDRLKQA